MFFPPAQQEREEWEGLASWVLAICGMQTSLLTRGLSLSAGRETDKVNVSVGLALMLWCLWGAWSMLDVAMFSLASRAWSLELPFTTSSDGKHGNTKHRAMGNKDWTGCLLRSGGNCDICPEDFRVQPRADHPCDAQHPLFQQLCHHLTDEETEGQGGRVIWSCNKKWRRGEL